MAKPPPSYVLVEEADFVEFEWEAAKRETNWYIHEVDFEDVEEIFLVMERTAGRLWVY